MKSDILCILKSRNDYVSGAQISGQLGISRTAVWKYIKKLRSEGYEIKSLTNKGYKLVFSPDIISAELIIKNIGTDFFAHNVCYYDAVASTNITAKENSHKPDGTLFIADTQTAGRGRLGRAWIAPESTGIWMSILLKPDIEFEKVAQITLAAGMGVCCALSDLCGVDAKIKWPNDIVIGSKKVCGILTELSADMDGVNYVVTGIGINVNNESFDDSISSKATSVYMQTNKKHNRSEIVRHVMAEFEKYYKLLIKDGFSAFRSEYKRLCVNMDKEVLIIKNNISTKAYCIDITDSGNLIVDINSETVEVNSGEVSVRGIYDYI